MTCGVRAPQAAAWRLGLVCLMAAAVLTGCSGIASVSESLFMMTPEQEVRFGAQVAQEVRGRVQFVDDETVLNYVRDVGGRIVRTAPHSDVPIRFYAIKDDSINAFAVPGGNIYVHTGLIKAADDESELAAVIAHEIGHVVRRHAARQVSHTVGVSMIEQSIVGNNSPQSAQLVSTLIAKGVLFDFSREDELEADTIAVRTLYNAGYDPQGLKRLFAKLTQNTGEGTRTGKILESISTLASTHPPTRERMANVDQIVRGLPTRPYPAVTAELRRVQGRMKQIKLVQ